MYLLVHLKLDKIVFRFTPSRVLEEGPPHFREVQKKQERLKITATKLLDN